MTCNGVDEKPDLMPDCARKNVSTKPHPILAVPSLDGLVRFESRKFAFRLNVNLPFHRGTFLRGTTRGDDT
jgi:hypothetical protein